MQSSKLAPTYVDLTKLVFIKEIDYEALPQRFLRSPIVRRHILPRELFSLHLARCIAMGRFQMQASRSAHTVMPQPTIISIYKHKITNKQFFKCTFPNFHVLTFFKETNGCISVKLELDVSIYFTTSGHLSFVERTGEENGRRLLQQRSLTPEKQQVVRGSCCGKTKQVTEENNGCSIH